MGRTSDARERLLRAAIDLIWPNSYGAVGVEAICEAAGVKKGSFYHFFPSKDALVVAAMEFHWESRRPAFDEIFSCSRPPLERFHRYFDSVVARQTEVRRQYGRVLGCFHHSIGTECIQHPAEVAAKAQDILVGITRYFETAFRDAQAAGVIRRGDASTDARTLFAYVEGALGQARIYDDLDILRRLPETALALVGVPLPPRPRAGRHSVTVR